MQNRIEHTSIDNAQFKIGKKLTALLILQVLPKYKAKNIIFGDQFFNNTFQQLGKDIYIKCHRASIIGHFIDKEKNISYQQLSSKHVFNTHDCKTLFLLYND